MLTNEKRQGMIAAANLMVLALEQEASGEFAEAEHGYDAGDYMVDESEYGAGTELICKVWQAILGEAYNGEDHIDLPMVAAYEHARHAAWELGQLLHRNRK